MKTKRVKTDTFCVFNCKYSVIIWLSSFFECRTFLFMNFFSKIHHLPTTWTNHPVVFLLFSFENKLQSWQSTLKVNDISTSIFFSNAIKYMINLICFLLLESLLFYIFHLKITNINTCYQWARHTYPRTGVPYQDIHKSLGQFHTCLLCILLIHFCLFQYLRVSILSFLCINQEDQRSHIIESRWCNGVFLHFVYKKNLCSLANEQNKITGK